MAGMLKMIGIVAAGDLGGIYQHSQGPASPVTWKGQRLGGVPEKAQEKDEREHFKRALCV